jgi:hypothetical protein
LLHFGGRGKKGTCFCRNIVPAKKNPWKVTLEKKGTWNRIPFFCRNLEVIPQDSWNWKANKRNAKRNAQPSTRDPDYTWKSKEHMLKLEKHIWPEIGRSCLELIPCG